MSVQYKTSDGWKNISSSSNNAVDTVENGNMSPVTSNAVYDALPKLTTGRGTIVLSGITAVDVDYVKYGKVVNVIIDDLKNQSGSDITPSGQAVIAGLPKAAHTQVIDGALTFAIHTDGRLGFTGATTWLNGASTWLGFTYITSE